MSILIARFFWNAIVLVGKLEEFRIYYNACQVYRLLDGDPPARMRRYALPYAGQVRVLYLEITLSRTVYSKTPIAA